MLALSPYLLLEVVAVREQTMDRCIVHNLLHKSKIREYRRRAINNTFKELICASREIAAEYSATCEWTERVRMISQKTDVSNLVMEADVGQMSLLRTFLATVKPR
jgi:hypothetical protein